MFNFSIFFFKQKTAYEMRISDWSSDVCSSDLLEGFSGEKEEMYLLLCLSALGGLTLACATHFASLFIGFELLSVQLSAMIAYQVKSLRPLEGGLKDLVLSAVASAFLRFGLALIDSQSGSLAFSEVAVSVSLGGR